MKRILLLFVVLQSAASIHASNIPYEKLDSISALVSKLQLRANGLTYNNGYADYELSFAEGNFKILFSTQLAYKSAYKKWNGKEVLFFTENIDLSKATGITWEVLGNSIIDVKLYFPKGLLKTQLFDNGAFVNTTNDDYLEFFSNDQSGDMLFNSLNDVCALFKIAAGLATEKKIADENRDWTALSETAFVNKYPSALRAKQANYSLTQKEEKKREEARIENEYVEKIRIEKEIEENSIKLKASRFIDSLCTKYNFKRGLTESEFISFNPEPTVIIKPSKRNRYADNNHIQYNNLNPKMGINIIVLTDGIVTNCEIMIMNEKGSSQSQLFFSNLLTDAKKNIPPQNLQYYINDEGNYQTITITDKNFKIEISYSIYYYGTKHPKSIVNITFSETK